ncbi:MAG: chalcone isomerase family protein [Deltaproteobacteria bacterium]|nr:chalcone isomerase family protein [Deltaproteobacteria bacterium]
MKKIFTFIFTILFLTAPYANSATVANVVLPDTYEVDGYFLDLNGTALRKKLIIKVYAGGFYAPFKITKLEQAINPEIPKAIRMHFIYKSVPGDKIRKIYANVYEKDRFDYKNSETAQTFLNFFSFEIKKGDTLDLVFPGNGDIRVVYNSKVIGSVNSADLCDATLKAYFGANSISGLKEGLLGLSDK